ncbi:hypothetical protein [Tepidimonas sp.]|uniref:hypothetical protein n=1 Tax=Tepidimonas sp. TaxID=2002775 RepID=UPI0028CD7873|nr:hypothetical protein [Tepidimonas sp.]MDT7929839.1 hypothetical protein [Tepidimonas sp.]
MNTASDETFEREMGCTVHEWLRWLPMAVGSHRWTQTNDGAQVEIGAGRLTLTWQPLPPRVIARLCLPRLSVQFRFDRVAADERQAFLRHFDLVMRRGGG